jgi:hypothetical protein
VQDTFICLEEFVDLLEHLFLDQELAYLINRQSRNWSRKQGAVRVRQQLMEANQLPFKVKIIIAKRWCIRVFPPVPC